MIRSPTKPNKPNGKWRILSMSIKIAFVIGFLLITIKVIFPKLRPAYHKSLTNMPKLKLTISGLSHVQKSTVENLIINIDINNINIKTLYGNIMKLNWIKSATVSKQLPNQLIIQIKEHIPFAVCLASITSNMLSVINENGEIIAHLPNPQDWSTIKSQLVKKQLDNLPIMYGTMNYKNCHHINLFKKHPKLYAKIFYFVRIERRRWNILLKNGCMLLLPEKDLQQSLARARAFIHRHGTDKFLKLDFRNSKRVVVQMRVNN